MSVSKTQYIIINDTISIKNARNEIVYQYHKGERVEILDIAKYYWITKHGAVWFSQAKHEAQVEKESELALIRQILKERQQLHMEFYHLLMTGQL